MTAEKTTMNFGRRVYGLGVMALAVICLAWGDFVLGQPVPKNFPGRTALAYAAGSFMLIAAGAVEWRRTTAWGAAALTAYYTVIVVVLMNGRLLLTHYSEFVVYSGIAEQLSIAAGGLIVYATFAKHRCGRRRAPHAPGPTGVRGVCAVIRRRAFCLYEPHRPIGPQMAAARARRSGLMRRGLASSQRALRC